MRENHKMMALDVYKRQYNKWADIRVNMDTLCENGTPDTGVELFGKTFKLSLIHI